MLTILSTLISFLMGGLPKLLDFFQDRNDKKHELALAAMQIERELELRKAGFEAQERVEQIHSQQLEMETKAKAGENLVNAQVAEMNAIYNACNSGVSLNGATLYVTGLPVCSECAKGIIQVGIKKVIMEYPKDIPDFWRDSMVLTNQMFQEAGVMFLHHEE